MASRKEFDMLFQLQAQMSGNFNSTFNKAQQAVVGMQKEIQALNKTQGDIASYQKQQGAVETTKQKLEVLQQQYDNIQREINETGTYSSDLQNKLLAKQQQIDRTSQSLNNQTQKLGELERALQEAGVDTGALTGEAQRLASELDELKRKQEGAAEGAKNFGKEGANAFDEVKQALAAAGLVAAVKEIGDAFADCISIAGNFEEAMSNVEALSGANAQEMAALSEKAKELGASTKFTAQEAADAMGYMGMAGWNAAQMIQGMDGVLQLAAASGEDLAMVSDIVTDNLTAFGMKASDTARFADVLAAAATGSNTSVSVMGETFKQSASVAGALGFYIEDVATAVGLMANAGVKGSTAGTALKNTFNGLLEGATFTGAAIGEYDFQAIKADGTMKTFMETMEELRDVFGELTEAEKVNNAMTLAGKRGYNGLLAIINATEEDFSKLALSIDNSTGAAQKMADIKLDNMNGQLTIAKSAWDGLKISIGEQLSPTMEKLYKTAADVFGAVNDFVKKNPGVVKAIAAISAGLAAVVATITAATVAIKLFNTLSMAMSANPWIAVAGAVAGLAVSLGAFNVLAGDTQSEYEKLSYASREYADRVIELSAEHARVSQEMGVTSAEAQILQAEMDEASAAFEAHKISAEDLSEMLQRTHENHARLIEDYARSSEAIRGEYAGNESLANKLGELTSLEEKDEVAKRRILTIVQLLNDSMPELGLRYDEFTGKVNMSTDAIIAMAQAENAKMQREADYSALQGAVAETQNLTDALANAQAETVAAKKAWDDYKVAYARSLEEQDNGLWNPFARIEGLLGWDSLKNDMDAAEQAYYNAIGAEKAAEIDLEENQALVQSLADSIAGVSEETETFSTVTSDYVNSVGLEINALAEAYEKAYGAALESVTGQYDLWDKADKVVATSVGSINSNLASQITYWDNYNANLEKLQGRTSDIEGLQEVIASFADGSKESVNAIAGMATASDADLKKMVEQYKTLQDSQSKTADSIADLKTDYTNEMNAIIQQMQEDVSQMTFDQEAAAAGQATLEAFINGADRTLPKLVQKYQEYGKAAADAFQYHLNISEYTAPKPISHYTPGLASGTYNAHQGWTMVGEHGPELMYFRGGEQVMPASKTADMLSGGTGTMTVQAPITITVEGSASAETIEALREQTAELADAVAEQVMERLEEAQQDARRRSYT